MKTAVLSFIRRQWQQIAIGGSLGLLVLMLAHWMLTATSV